MSKLTLVKNGPKEIFVDTDWRIVIATVDSNEKRKHVFIKKYKERQKFFKCGGFTWTGTLKRKEMAGQLFAFVHRKDGSDMMEIFVIWSVTDDPIKILTIGPKLGEIGWLGYCDRNGKSFHSHHDVQRRKWDYESDQLINGNRVRQMRPLTKKMYVKRKEMIVVSYLRKNIEKSFTHNRSVGMQWTATHLFPDIMFDCKTYKLIVEVDEHQHRSRSYKNDNQRMADIVAKVFQPCVFIRYNPDGPEPTGDMSKLSQLRKMVNRYLYDPIPWDIADVSCSIIEYMFYEVDDGS